jgi:hypothetical protein
VALFDGLLMLYMHIVCNSIIIINAFQHYTIIGMLYGIELSII